VINIPHCRRCSPPLRRFKARFSGDPFDPGPVPGFQRRAGSVRVSSFRGSCLRDFVFLPFLGRFSPFLIPLLGLISPSGLNCFEPMEKTILSLSSHLCVLRFVLFLFSICFLASPFFFFRSTRLPHVDLGPPLSRSSSFAETRSPLAMGVPRAI